MRQGDNNPLQRELARGQQVGPHPDADLLAAFAEGSLLEREREKIFAHLANCAQCREVLNVAMAAEENPVVGSKPFLMARAAPAPPRRWIPWASIAAAIVLVSTASLVYRQKIELKEPAAAENAALNTTETPAPTRPLSPISAEPSAAVSTTSAKQTAAKLKSAEPVPETAPTASAVAAPAVEPTQSDASDKKAQMESAGAISTNEQLAASTPSPARVQAPVQVQAQAQAGVQAQLQSLPAPAFAASGPARMLSKSSLAALAPRPKWRIDSTGVAERSTDAGEWKRVLPDENAKMRVVSVFNGEVWVGGENARLYHSADNGNTWSLITLPAKGGRDHTIVHISFKTRQLGMIEADDGTSWITTDGGVSWN